MRRFFFVFFTLILATGAFIVRGWNLRDVVVAGRIYFVDPDCYSRMARAQIVDRGEAWIIGKHEFENFPQGIKPHTTAPLDWLIVALQWPLLAIASIAGDALWTRALRIQPLDVAGALISPLLGAAACAWISWALSRVPRLPRGGWLAAACFFAISPILVHGTLLGRPDHQSLLLFLLAIALSAELRLANGELSPPARRGSALVAGTAWAVACWVSYYEPLVLFGIVTIFWAVADRSRYSARECSAGWISFAAILLVSGLIEGWRIAVPAGPLRDAFSRWSANIGELKPASFELLSAWLGWLGLFAPLLLAAGALLMMRARFRRSPAGEPAAGIEAGTGSHHPARAPLLLALLLVVLLALAAWQVRWGYFLALTVALSLPWLLQIFRRAWIAWPLFIISLWPMARAWDAQLFPDLDGERKRALHRSEAMALREIAEAQGKRKAGPFAAPWWLSPPIAYWSGLPGLAGSSHESIRGIVETARIYLAADAGEALPILQRNQIAWLLSYPPDRIIANSAALLGVPRPGKCFAEDLADAALPGPWTLALIRERGFADPAGAEFFHVWTVRPAAPADPAPSPSIPPK